MDNLSDAAACVEVESAWGMTRLLVTTSFGHDRESGTSIKRDQDGDVYSYDYGPFG